MNPRIPFAWLDSTIDQASRLSELLQHEQQALVRRAPAELEQIVADKQQLLLGLEEISRHAEDDLCAAGMPISRDGLRQLLQQHGNTRTRERWRELEHLCEQCRRQNQINATLVENGRRFLRQALALLRGESAEPAVYGRDGADTGDVFGDSRLLATI